MYYAIHTLCIKEGRVGRKKQKQIKSSMKTERERGKGERDSIDREMM